MTFRSLSAQYALAASTALFLARKAIAFGGPVPPLPGTPTGVNVRASVAGLLIFVLNFVALAAVVVIVIAGIRLIVSQGSDEQKDTAKKTIFYAIAGLVIILLARVIVGLVTNELPQFLVGT